MSGAGNEVTRIVMEKMPNIPPGELDSIVRQVMSRVQAEIEVEGIREKIVSVGKHLYGLGFLAGASGNISAKLADGTIIMTPSGLVKGHMSKEDLVHIDSDGNLVTSSPRRPSSEARMHLHAYKRRPDVKAIVHAHPPFSTGFAAAGLALDMPVLPEAILILGKVPLASYGCPSTGEVPDSLDPYVRDHDVFLLANHGALALGKDLTEASHRMETLELFAQVVVISRMLGGEKVLSAENLDKLLKVHGRK